MKIFRNIEFWWGFFLKRIIFLLIFIRNVNEGECEDCCCCCKPQWHDLLDRWENNIKSNLQIHFLYVGEGDSIIIKYHSDEKNKDFIFIVDAGEGLSFVKKRLMLFNI